MSAPLEALTVPLLEWFRDNARILPWRSDPTPYHVWLSEIMLQQTRVAAVLGYYERFLNAAPTVGDLAALDEDELMKLWQGLGYYNRARNLQKAARQVVEQYGGQFPARYEQLRALAGVGDYTAGAIASIAFGQPVPAVDGNVLRVVSRISGSRDDITQESTKGKIRAALERVIPHADPGRYNQALMELGATVCLPNGAPLCDRCPAREFCRAYLEGLTEQLPVKTPKKERRVEEREVWLLFRRGRVALRRRPDKGLLAGLWEYPNALAGTGESAAWGLSVEPAGDDLTGRHIFTHVEWRMTARVFRALTDDLPEGWVWADRGALARRYAVPGAFKAFEAAVERYLAMGGDGRDL